MSKRHPKPKKVRYETETEFKYSIDNGIEIKTSQVPHAGDGVFATVDIPKNTFITHYGGSILKARDVDRLDAKDCGYLLALGPEDDSLTIDGSTVRKKKGNMFGSMINDARNKKLYNVQMQLGQDKKSVEVYTTRDIKEGEELYWNYGRPYWSDTKKRLGIKPQKLSEWDVPTYLERMKAKEKTRTC